MRGEKKRKKGHKLFDFPLFFYSSLVPLLLFSLQEKKEMSCRVSVPRCPRPCGFARGEQHKKCTRHTGKKQEKRSKKTKKKIQVEWDGSYHLLCSVYYYTHAARWIVRSGKKWGKKKERGEDGCRAPEKSKAATSIHCREPISCPSHSAPIIKCFPKSSKTLYELGE
jgi:hypothetical protein